MVARAGFEPASAEHTGFHDQSSGFTPSGVQDQPLQLFRSTESKIGPGLGISPLQGNTVLTNLIGFLIFSKFRSFLCLSFEFALKYQFTTSYWLLRD